MICYLIMSIIFITHTAAVSAFGFILLCTCACISQEMLLHQINRVFEYVRLYLIGKLFCKAVVPVHSPKSSIVSPFFSQICYILKFLSIWWMWNSTSLLFFFTLAWLQMRWTIFLIFIDHWGFHFSQLPIHILWPFSVEWFNFLFAGVTYTL